MQFHNCFLNDDETNLLKMKKQLSLIKPALNKIILQSLLGKQEINPLGIMNKFVESRGLKHNTIYGGLNKDSTRHLKKKFDNIIADLKKEIYLKKPKLKPKKIKRIRKTKKY